MTGFSVEGQLAQQKRVRLGPADGRPQHPDARRRVPVRHLTRRAPHVRTELGVPALKTSDVTWLTDELGDAILSRDITAHFKGLHRDGLANRSVIDNAMRITEKGEEYLAAL
ncbi:hypothetical protein ABT034_00930 [Streptomyces sp. NPDC002773]|uniref:hypothetical protein n=1 Tax=Streptomyces sp. NPDC002773 TaxID=3154430 RepID=UPI0033213AA6